MTEAKDDAAAIAAIQAQLEAEGLAAEEQAPSLSPSQTIAGKLTDLDEIEETIRTGNSPEFRGVRDWIPQADVPVPLPLADLRERIAILCAAGVTHYRDAGVEMHIDPESRKRATETRTITERF